MTDAINLSLSDRPHDYDDGSWDSYERCLQSMDKKGSKEEGKNTYLPSPKEIKKRMRMQHWLYKLGVSDKIMDLIMIHDCPHIDVVRRMVLLYGFEEAGKKLTDFIEDDCDDSE